ncbi:MAG: beta-N-acetylhexosaminidase [Mariprofundales bacterium]|nr:beta-N-acetylhexosaminidase [Mariprofundales bacterium]
MRSRLIIGLMGEVLTAREQHWLNSSPPAGIMLFSRNASSPDQVRGLIDQARAAAGSQLWAAIDEEGGRVFRLPWSPFDSRPSAAEWGERYANNPAQTLIELRHDAQRCGEELATLGFTHNCAPVLDLRHSEGHGVVGNRSFGSSATSVADLGMAVMDGLLQAGISAVGKHFPGHGLAECDSHIATPRVYIDESSLMTESSPFTTLINHGIEHIMTAHVRYPQQDREIATLSPYWINRLRSTHNFSGTIWSDDLSMGGAGESLATALQAAASAGCDRLLVCQPEDLQAIINDEVECCCT